MHHLPSRYIPCDGRLTASAYFKSTLPAWGATMGGGTMSAEELISIHAPSMGSDPCGGRYTRILRNFNPRPPHGERRNGPRSCLRHIHFNPRSPHGERLARRFATMGINAISIHAPRMGSDILMKILNVLHRFQSTLPAWGATMMQILIVSLPGIFQSTLPAWGATSLFFIRAVSTDDFNPRSPHGERQDQWIYAFDTEGFQSTLPAWGATQFTRYSKGKGRFQSTLPAWGATKSILR